MPTPPRSNSRVEFPASPAPEGLKPGALIDLGLGRRYQLVQWLAQAGCGQVWEAEAWPHGMRVALKLSRAPAPGVAHGQRQASAMALAREAQLGARLSHRHLVRCLARGLYQGGAVLVMERLALSLDRHLRGPEGSPRALGVDEVWRLGRHVAEGLRSLHAAGLRHLDLKPGNVMLTPDRGLGQWAKLVDFGASLPEGVQLHGFFGTPGWLSPQQIRPVGRDADGGLLYHTDCRTDWHALGLLLFRMLTGRQTRWAALVQSVAGKQAHGLAERLAALPAPASPLDDADHSALHHALGWADTNPALAARPPARPQARQLVPTSYADGDHPLRGDAGNTWLPQAPLAMPGAETRARMTPKAPFGRMDARAATEPMAPGTARSSAQALLAWIDALLAHGWADDSPVTSHQNSRGQPRA